MIIKMKLWALAGILISAVLPLGVQAQEEQAAYVRISDILDAERNIIEERYLDEEGNPVMGEEGYASFKKEYDEAGRETKISYYDIEGKPAAPRKLGYAIVTKHYDEEGRLISEFYFGEDTMPLADQGHPSREWIYDGKGRVIREFYRNGAGEPCMNPEKGYAALDRTYDERGFETDIRYYDEYLAPVSVNGAGHISREYDESGKIISERMYLVQEELISEIRDSDAGEEKQGEEGLLPSESSGIAETPGTESEIPEKDKSEADEESHEAVISPASSREVRFTRGSVDIVTSSSFKTMSDWLSGHENLEGEEFSNALAEACGTVEDFTLRAVDRICLLARESSDTVIVYVSHRFAYASKRQLQELIPADVCDCGQLPVIADYRSLTLGMTGEDVALTQNGLILLGYLDGEADGIYGEKSVSAVKAFQQREGFNEDGIATGVQQLLIQAMAESSDRLSDQAESESAGQISDQAGSESAGQISDQAGSESAGQISDQAGSESARQLLNETDPEGASRLSNEAEPESAGQISDQAESESTQQDPGADSEEMDALISERFSDIAGKTDLDLAAFLDYPWAGKFDGESGIGIISNGYQLTVSQGSSESDRLDTTAAFDLLLEAADETEGKITAVPIINITSRGSFLPDNKEVSIVSKEASFPLEIITSGNDQTEASVLTETFIVRLDQASVEEVLRSGNTPDTVKLVLSGGAAIEIPLNDGGLRKTLEAYQTAGVF